MCEKSNLAKQTLDSGGCTNFNLKSLSTGKIFAVKNALVVPNFEDEQKILPHAVDVQNLEHFKGVDPNNISLQNH